MKRLTLLLILLSISSSVLAANVRIQVIDRGQADGMLIRTPNHEWVVIDAGTNKQQAEAMKNDWGVDELALAIVSHRHWDHQGGMDDVINAITTKQFIGITEDCPDRSSDDIVRDAVANNNVDIIPLVSLPDEHVVDGVTFTVFPLPNRADCPDHENLNSVVVRLDYGDFSMLFTGDAEESELDWLVQHHSGLLDVDILKASHHGSNNGYTDEFLAAVSPQKVVISAVVHGNHKHPHKGAVEAYEQATSDKVYCTNRYGSLRIYGYEDGRSRIYKQRQNNKSCVYDGTHY